MSDSIEFIIRPSESLYLEGTNKHLLLRIKVGEEYPCQMQKNQSFSCLFNHYAKHNGLDKDNLRFFFVDELSPDETPLSVHLMPSDEIRVEHRIKPTVIGGIDDNEKERKERNPFPVQFKSLLDSGDHADVTFEAGGQDFHAHKAILSARCEYFKAMFKSGTGMIESEIGNAKISHDASTFGNLLEYIYTNNVADLFQNSAENIIALLMAADEYDLTDLKSLCETAATGVINDTNIGKLLLISKTYRATSLQFACEGYLTTHLPSLKKTATFRKELVSNPRLALLILDAIPDDANCSSPTSKRRRIADAVNDFDDDDDDEGGESTNDNDEGEADITTTIHFTQESLLSMHEGLAGGVGNGGFGVSTTTATTTAAVDARVKVSQSIPTISDPSSSSSSSSSNPDTTAN